MERLQRKFATIHSTLAQQQTQKPAEPPASPLRTSVPSSVNVAESFPKVCMSGHDGTISLDHKCGCHTDWS